MKKCLLVSWMLIASPLSAQQIITDRPDQTESASTVPRGSLQIEGGISR